MSGTVSVPNTFANAVTATGAQLDANYSTLVAYINDPTNRNNYAVDSGGTNTIALSFSPAIAGFTGGLELTFKAATTNSGGVVLIPNSVGTRTVVNADGSALSAGQIQAGMVYKTIDDGTRAVFIGPSIPATQAQVVAATVGGAFITPATTKYAPGAAKAWALWSGTATGTIAALASYNVGSIIRGGTGTYTISMATGFSSTAWVGIATPATAAEARISILSSATAEINCFTTLGVASDATFVNFVAYGTLP